VAAEFMEIVFGPAVGADDDLDDEPNNTTEDDE
jgi:hypothetical protein